MGDVAPPRGVRRSRRFLSGRPPRALRRPRRGPRVAVELFSVSGGWAKALRAQGWLVHEVDIKISLSHDLTTEAGQRMAWNLCLQADWIHAGIPCNTFSTALRGRTILRSRRFPWGLPDLTSAQSSKVHAANALVKFVVRLIRMCRRIGKCISVENPASSKLWSNPLLERELYRSKRTTLDYCAFHKPWRKRTIF